MISLQDQQSLLKNLVRKSHAVHMGCGVVIQTEYHVSHLLHLFFFFLHKLSEVW